jgi:hypothetical protein
MIGLYPKPDDIDKNQGHKDIISIIIILEVEFVFQFRCTNLRRAEGWIY